MTDDKVTAIWGVTDFGNRNLIAFYQGVNLEQKPGESADAFCERAKRVFGVASVTPDGPMLPVLSFSGPGPNSWMLR